MYRLLRDNVYLTKEYTLKNIFFGHARAKSVCVQRGSLRHSKISEDTAIIIIYFAEIKDEK